MISVDFLKLLVTVNSLLILALGGFTVYLDSKISLLVQVSECLSDILKNNTESLEILTRKDTK